MFNGGKVVGVRSVAEVDGARGRDGVSETLCQMMISFDEDSASSFGIGTEQKFLPLFVKAIRSQTYQLPKLWTQQDLPDTQPPLRSEVSSPGGNLYMYPL